MASLVLQGRTVPRLAGRLDLQALPAEVRALAARRRSGRLAAKTSRLTPP
jgi:hypothetical protein